MKQFFRGLIKLCKVYTKVLKVSSDRRFQVIKITSLVEKVVLESGIKEGLVHVFVPHATAAVITNEYEPRIVDDYIEWVVKNIPPNYRWRHNEIDNNAHAHIASALIGPSRTFPVANNGLVRGTWQEIMLLELDGPRSARKVVVEVIGE